MIPPYDILRNDPEALILVEVSLDLKSAQARVRELMSRRPAEYIISSQVSGRQAVISPERDKEFEALRRKLARKSGDSLQLVSSLADNPICSLTFDNTLQCIVIVWKQHANRDQFRFIHESILDLIERHKTTKMLGDDTALPTILAEDRIWIAQNWMPRAVAAGLKFAGTKNPKSYFGELAVSALRQAAPAGLTIRAFDDIDEARQWLEASDTDGHCDA